MDSIYLTKTQREIMILLVEKPDGRFSIRHIARMLGKSYTLTYNNIQGLIKKSMVTPESVPPAIIIRLHDRTPTPLLIEIERTRARAFLKRFPWCDLYLSDLLRAAPHPFFALLIFGSYAKGTFTKQSDLDLLIILPRKEDIPSFETATQQYTPVKKNPIIIQSEDFLGMIQNPSTFNVGNETKKAHILLYGAETYHQLLEKI